MSTWTRVTRRSGLSRPRKRRGTSPSNDNKRGRQDLQGQVDQAIRQFQRQTQSYKKALISGESKPSIQHHKLRPLTAMFPVTSHSSIMDSATEFSSIKLQQLFPVHAPNIVHIEFHPSNQDKSPLFIAHFSSKSTFESAITDPTSPFSRSNQSLDRGGWLPNEHAERMLILNLPKIDIPSEEYSQLVRDHVHQTTGVVVKRITFPKGTTNDKFHAIATLSQPITPQILNQIQSQPFHNSTLTTGGTSNPRLYRCTNCNGLGHKNTTCPKTNSTSITLHFHKPIFPYQKQKIEETLHADHSCMGIPFSNSSNTSDSSKTPNTITLTFHNPETLIKSLKSPSAQKLFAYHVITHSYKFHRGSLCVSCHHPPSSPSYSCPNHRQIPNPKQKSNKPSPERNSETNSQPTHPKNSQQPTQKQNPKPPTPTTQDDTKSLENKKSAPSPIDSKDQPNSLPKQDKPANQPSKPKPQEFSIHNPAPPKLKPKSSHSNPQPPILRTDLSTSPERPPPIDMPPTTNPSKTPSPPTTTTISQGIPSYSNLPSPEQPPPTDMPPTTNSSKTTSPPTATTIAQGIPSYSNLLSPSKPPSTPTITTIAKGINSYSNLLSPSILQHLQQLAENPPVEVKNHKKHHQMAFFGKPNHHPALIYSWGNESLVSKTWSPHLDEALKEIQPHLTSNSPNFNSCLLNIFRDGSAISPRHCDKVQNSNEYDHVVLICLGATRPFLFTNKKSKLTKSILLRHGEVVVIEPDGNKYWLHERPSCLQITDPSYSFSFRVTPPLSALS